jgi:hypothetical protein
MEVLQTLWNLHEMPMRFKEYGSDEDFQEFQPSDDHLTDADRELSSQR